MRKLSRTIIAFLTCLAMASGVLPITAISFFAAGADEYYAGNFLPESSSTFENISSVSSTGWTVKYGSPVVSVVNDGASNCLKIQKASTTGASYHSPAINLAQYITYPGEYTITMDYMVKGGNGCKPFTTLLRTDKLYSFSENVNGNLYGELSQAPYSAPGTWYTYKASFTVTAADVASKNTWNFCLHKIDANISEIYLDNVQLVNPWSANIIPAVSSDFESAATVSDTGWSAVVGTLLSKEVVTGTEGKYLHFTKAGGSNTSYFSAGINLAQYINKPGSYYISFDYKVNGADGQSPFSGVIRTDKSYSFVGSQGNYRGLADARIADAETWQNYTGIFTVTESDVANKGTWNFFLHNFKSDVTDICIDNFTVKLKDDEGYQRKTVSRASTWVCNEAVFISSNTYADPYNNVTLDLILTMGSQQLEIPAFWDGGNIWRARFACPSVGEWTYTTVCSDTTNTGLHGVTGTVHCTAYEGAEKIYQHGFVKTDSNKRYFTYADGTPFFYLGDTHWGLGSEDVNNIETLVRERVKQNFTVIQSEPIGAKYNVKDGITQSDINAFRENDAKFEVIARYGFVHANAEFFFPSEMKPFIIQNGGWSSVPVGTATNGGDSITVYDLSEQAKTALSKLSRFWVARYGAYPVMWTLGQEVDNDFYWERDANSNHAEWSYVNNPYVYVAECIASYDCYSHPLSAHQESVINTIASNSAFRDCSAHNWYASQWSQNYGKKIDQQYPEDFWNNGQGKPVVLYEGKYCYLWTKNFGARVQGWMAYLSGMCGCAWGGQDTWCYGSTYGEDELSGDGVDIITPEDKQQATWEDSLRYPSVLQLGYMHGFFENIVGNWYELTPRFDDTEYFAPASDGVFPISASTNDGTKAVVYFYNFSDPTIGKKPNATAENGVKTGVLGGLQANTQYNYIWFDPVTGQIADTGSFRADASGKWTVPNKAQTDMTLYVCVANSSCTHSNAIPFAAMSSTCTRHGHAAYTYCPDCNKVTSGSSALYAFAPHTPGEAATCTENQVCVTCGAVITERLGHDYSVSVLQPGCENTGSITHTCNRCGYVTAKEINALGHTDFETVKIGMGESRKHIVSNDGSQVLTPFKTLEFSGNSVKVKAYVYNNTSAQMDRIELNYIWGHYAYDASQSSPTLINGTGVSVSIPAHSGKIVELTIPRTAIYSNKEGSFTDGNTDSLGTAISYRDVGLRFMLSNDTTGDIYVSFIGAEAGASFGALTQSFQKTGMKTNDTETLISGLNNLKTANTSVYNAVVQNLFEAGYLNGTPHDHTCTSSGTFVTSCLRCDREIGSVLHYDSPLDHTAGPQATCTEDQVCTVCGAVLATATGHAYSVTAYTAPTCTQNGSITYHCSKCGGNKTETVPALGHADFETAAISKANTNFFVGNSGEEKSPFRFVDFAAGQESKEISFYLFNNTTATVTLAALNYKWGFYAYPSNGSLTRIPGTYAALSLAPGQGTTVTLTLPRECYYSNAYGQLTDGNTDSCGQTINYRDVGIRFMFDESTSGTLYVTCLNEPTVNTYFAASGAYDTTSSVSLVRSTENVPAAMLSALESIGYYGNKTEAPTCEHEGSYGKKCVHCNDFAFVTVQAPALGHCSADTAKLTITAQKNHLVVNSGTNRITPFRFVDMNGADSKTIEFYIYNDSSAALTGIAFCYDWGFYAYADEAHLTRVAGTYVECNIAAHTGGTVQLTLPASCCYSNLYGQITEGAHDSLGLPVSYQDVGIRFRFSTDTTGSIYITCPNEATVAQQLVAAGTKATSDGKEYISSRSVLPVAAREALTACGYLKTVTRTFCTQNGYEANGCVHCNQAIMTEIIRSIEPTGHSYQYVVTAPTTTSGGKVEKVCTVCGDTITVHQTGNLQSTSTEAAKYTISEPHSYIVSRSGADSETPFRYLNFGNGSTCTVRLYIYNNTGATITSVSLNYDWGYIAYSDPQNLVRIAGTYASVSIAPGTGAYIELTVPEACYFSNLLGSITDGAHDSLGNMVSYRDVGIRYMLSAETTGDVLVKCLSDPTVTQMLVRTGSRVSKTTASLVTNAANLPAAFVAAQ